MGQFSKEWYAAYQARRLSSSAESEPTVRNEPVGEKERASRLSPGLVVRIVSFRCRILDADNLVGGTKFFTDGLRHAGLIPDDRPQDIILEVRQEKVASKSSERTEIVIEPA